MKRKQRNIGNRIQLVIDEMLHLLGNSSTSNAEIARGRSLHLTKLEERVLMSASPVAMVAQVATVAVESSPITDSAFTSDFDLAATESVEFNSFEANVQTDADANDENSTVTSAAVRGIELIVIDSRVQDADTLLESLLNTDRDFRLLRLDANTDGLTQITDKLEQLGNVSAIHLLTHGNTGEILLGSTVLNADTLAQHAPELVAWQHNLTANADILLYGCDVAATTEGKDFVESLHKLTGVDIAASVDATGHEVFGGNWDLEFTTGVIETSSVFTQNVQQNWLGKLASINVTTFADTVDGDTSSVANLLANKGSDNAISLREAILAINAGAGGDVINLSADTYTLSRVGTGEDLAYTGDLDILKNVTIVGAGTGTTTIDANGIDRAFDIRGASGQLTVSGVTVQGGNAGGGSGGGFWVETATNSLTLNNVVVQGNSASAGAGIDNAGTLTLTDVTIQNNGNMTTTTQGGGLRNTANASLNRVTISGNRSDLGGGIYNDFGTGNSITLTNVTMSGNAAQSSGGGIYTRDNMTVVNSTITLNTSDTGGGIRAQAGSVNLKNTIVAGNIGTSANPDLVGTFVSSGSNLIGNGTGQSGLTHGVNGDMVGTGATPISPLLGALQNNGGSTLTHALLAGSTAIDAGTTTGAPTADQRGISRVGLVDIGAYEYVPTLTPTGELAVNVTTGQTQQTSGQTRGSTKAVSITPSGNYVVVWTSNQTTGLDANGRGVLMRAFQPDGTPLTGEIQVNQTFNSDQQWATVATDDAGNGVVVWTSTGQDSGGTTGVYARRFNAAGALVGNEFLVNTTVAGNQENAAVAMTGGGAFVVTWSGNGVGDAAGVFYRRFAANGTPLDITERLANGTDRGTELAPSIAINDAGQFAIAWHVGNDLYTRNFAANGTAVTADIQVDNGLANAYGSAVGIDALGRTVVVYRTDGFLTTGSGVWARAFNADGTEWHTWIAVASGTGTDQTSPSIAMDDAGNFIVTYESSGDGSGNAVYVRRYNSDFSAAGIVQQVNVTNAGNQQMASVAMLDLKNYVVVWSGQGPGDNDGVFARQFSSISTAPTALALSAVADTYIDSGATGINHGVTTSLVVDRSGQNIGNQRALLRFDLSNLPAGTVILSASLKMNATQNNGAFDVNVYELTENWVEGNVNGTASVANWTQRQTGTNWTTAGGTYDSTVVATLNTGATGLHSWDITSLVTAWQSGSKANNGIILGSPNTGTTTIVYDSREGATPPVLELSVLLPGTAPTITSNGGGATASINVVENSTDVTTVTATDADVPAQTLTYSIIGGADAAKFTINSSTGGVSFITAPDFELPTDVDGNNVYDVIVQVSDGALVDTQTIAVTISNAVDFTTLYLKGQTDPNGPPLSDLSTQVPVATSLINYDPVRDSIVGLKIAKGGIGANETDDTKHHTWVISGSVNITNQDVQLLFWTDILNGMNGAQTADVALGKSGSVTAYLMDLPSGTTESGGTVIASGTVSDPTWGDGFAWEQKAISFGTVNYSVADGRYLAVKLVVNASSGDDVWFAYDTASFSSRVEIGGAHTAPIITSNGGGATAAINVTENTTAVTSVTATDADLPTETLTYSIVSGGDGAKFTINSATGVLRFITAPDFEIPTDVGANNVYDVVVEVSDGVLFDSQAIAVTVTDQAVTVLTTTGNATVTAGSVYTLNLAANEDVTSWTVNWGDGLIQTFVGNPASVTHIYNNAGFTSNILASATDASGTVFQNQLLVPTYTGGDSVFRFAPTTGGFLQEFATTNGLNDAIQAIIGPDGNLYVTGEASNNVLRYNATTGAFIDQFVAAGSGGLSSPGGLAFGPDGNLYVANYSGKNVLRYNANTGAFMNVFLSTGSANPYSLTFGPDGNLYIGMYSTNEVRRYNGTTGALIGTFVSAGSGGLNKPEQMIFGPDGNLYVASLNSDQVLRYNGTTGAFMNVFVSTNSGGLDGPSGLAFGPDGNLYVTGLNSNNVLRYNGTTGAFLNAYVTAGSGGLATPTMLTFLPQQQVKVLAPPVNNPPTITSDGGGATASINVAENTTAVTTVTASDADLPAQMLSYSIIGGADSAKFAINSSTGVLSFITAPDFESATDAGANNIYDVTVQVSDGTLTDTQAISVTVTNVNDIPPVVTVGQSFSVSELATTGTTLGTVAANDGDGPTTYSNWQITAGNDGGVFAINASTGLLTIASTANLNFDITPSYILSVTVSDGVNTSVVQTVSITVLDSPNTAPVASNDSYTVLEGGTLNQTAVSNWFNSNWQYRQQLVFNNSASSTNLINTAVLVKLHASATDAIQIDYSATQDSGQDLRFVDSDGTVLAYEIEQWNESGYSYVWVKVPQIDGGSTTDSISMYYGNPAAAAGQNPQAVWNGNTAAVFHLNSNANDSTSNANNGLMTNVGGTSGKFASSGTFDGATSSINAGSATSVDNIFAGGGAVSAWINPVGWGEGGYGRIADKGNSTSSAQGWGFQVAGTNSSDGYLLFESDFSLNVGRWRTAAGTVALNTWQNVVVVYDNSSTSNVPRLYVNGTQLAITLMSAPVGTARSDAAQDLTIGNRSGATDRTFNGKIDEVRISSTSLTSDQIKADYKSGQGTFVSASAVQTGPGGLLDNDFDVNSDPLSVTLVSEPAHAASFTLNPNGSFNYVHDGSETTADSFTYRVSDGTLSNTATVFLTITPVNDNNPVITSNGAGATAAINVAENTTAVTTVTATDADLPSQTLSYSISGGVDASKFTINSSTGVLRFATAPDFETPTDVGANNIYNVIVEVSDGLLVDTQEIAVTVTDIGGPLIVDTNLDTLDGDTSSVETLLAFKGNDGKISLREAIIAANNTPGAQVISLGNGVYTLARTGINEESGATGDLDISGNVTIQGTGSGTTVIDGGAIDRVFDLKSSSIVTIQDITVRNGAIGNKWGGGINIETGSFVNLYRVVVSGNSGDSGGGIYSYKATVVAVDTTISGNSGKWGGGFYNDGGTATLQRVTVSGNTATTDGAGIYNVTTGATLALTNVTISGNTTTGNGGGLYTKRAVTITNSTIVNNTGSSGGGIYIASPGTATLKNTIAALNTGGNSNAAVISLGNNLDSGNTLGLSQSGDLINTDPLLNALQQNGGYTKTHALRIGSLAINAGSSIGTPLVDQRGVVRDASVDIGAYEFVAAVSNPPVAVNDSYSVDEDSILTLAANGVLSNDTDADTDPLTAHLISGPTNGVLNLNSDGSLTYTPDANFNGVDSFTYRASDGLTYSGVATVSITVNDVNDDPIITSNGGGANSAINVSENTTAVTTVISTDIDGGTAVYSIVGGDDQNRFVINSTTGVLKFVTGRNFESPTDANLDNIYVVTVQVSDGNGGFASQMISVQVVNVDEAPTANAGGPYTISEGGTLTVIAGTSVDPEGLPLTYAWDIDGDGQFTDATGSTASLTWNQLKSLTNTINDNGTRAVALRVTDAGGNSTVATTTLTINNTAPTVNVTGNASTTSGTPYAINIAKSDPGADTISTYQINWGDGVTQNIAGTATSATHTFLTPGGTRSITVTATDEDGTFPMTTGPLVVTVNNTTPTAPTLSDARVAAFTRGATVGTLSFNDPDFGDAHTWTVSDSRFRVDGAVLKLKSTRELNPLTEPTVILTVTVTDASGASSSADFTLRVNNPPVSLADAYAVDGTQQLSVSSPSLGVLANDSDANNDSLTASLISGPSHAATFGLNANGTFWYRAAAGYSGLDTFRYQATDGQNVGEITTVTFTVNQPATLGYASLVGTIPEHQTLTTAIKVGTFTIVDDGVGTNTLTLSGADAALFELDNSNQLFLKVGLTINYDVNTQFQVTAMLDDASIAGTPDAIQTVTIAVQNLNEVPTATALPNISVLEDALPGTISTASAFNDPDGDPLNYLVQVVTQTPGLIKTISIDQTTGVISYSLHANAHGTATLRVTAKDPFNASASQQFQLTVQPVNDAPVAQNYSNSVFFNQTLTANLQSSVSDVDMDTLTLTIVSGPAHGSIILLSNGSFVYTPNGSFQGTDTFRFAASDGVISSNIGTATITVLRQIVIPSNGSSGGSGLSGFTSTTTTATGNSSSSGNATTATSTENSTTSGTSGAIASGGSSRTGGNGVIQFETTDFIGGTQGTLTDNAEQDQDRLVGILPKLKGADLERINVKAVDASANEFGRSLTNEFSRRTFKTSERYNFDSIFDQNASNPELSELNAQRELVYREISALAEQQSASVAEQLENNTHFKGRVVGSVGVVTTGFSVGYLFWVIRGGMLVSGLIAQVPAWSMLDPLLVVDGDQNDDDKESLQNIMDRQQAKMKSTPETTDNIQANTSASESNSTTT